MTFSDVFGSVHIIFTNQYSICRELFYMPSLYSNVLEFNIQFNLNKLFWTGNIAWKNCLKISSSLFKSWHNLCTLHNGFLDCWILNVYEFYIKTFKTSLKSTKICKVQLKILRNSIKFIQLKSIKLPVKALFRFQQLKL